MQKLTEFGKAIKIKLVEIGCSQEWLIEQVRQKTGLYFDRSYLSKVLTGKIATPKIISAIQDILGLKDTGV